MPTVTTPSRYFGYSRSEWYNSTGVPISLVSTPSMNVFGLGGNDITTGTSNKDYKILIAKGLDASTAYRRVINTAETTYSKASARNNSTKDVTSGFRYYYGTGTDFPAYTNDAGLLDVALTRFKRKLKKQIGAIDLVVPVVELRDLRRTIAGAAQLTTGLLNNLISIKRTMGASALKSASAAWLTYSFGMRPLMADTDAICKAIVAFLENKNRNVRLVGSSTKDTLSGDRNLNTTLCTGVIADYYGSQHHVLSYRYTGAFDLKVKASNDYGLVEHFGLEPYALVSAFWELTAFSWVVDYFTTVGDYLDDTFFTLPGQMKYIVLNRRYTGTYNDEVRFRPSNTDWVLTSQSMKRGTVKVIDFERTIVTSLPTQSLRFRSIDEVGKNGINKLLNLASVFSQVSNLGYQRGRF